MLPAVALAAHGIENLDSRTRQIDNAGATLQAQLERGGLDPRLVAKLEELLDDAQALSKLYDDCESRSIHSVPDAKCGELRSDLIPRFLGKYEKALHRVHTSRLDQLKTVSERSKQLDACAETLGDVLDASALSRNMQSFRLDVDEDVALGNKIALAVRIIADDEHLENAQRALKERLGQWSEACYSKILARGTGEINPAFLERANRVFSKSPFVVVSSGRYLRFVERERTIHHVYLRNRRTGNTEVLAVIRQQKGAWDGEFVWNDHLFSLDDRNVRFVDDRYAYRYEPYLILNAPHMREHRASLNLPASETECSGREFRIVVDPDDWVLGIEWDAEKTARDAADIVLLNEANAEYKQYVREERAKRGAKH